ncbi:MAG: YheC/YheD family protein [Firmicutes bacterium]|nr:YheC/YheD family protein [Bacillota bacterium]
MTTTMLTQPQGNRLSIPLAADAAQSVKEDSVTIQVGRRELLARPDWKGTHGRVVLSASALDQLHLGPEILRVDRRQRHIRLGPVIAVYAIPFTGKRPFGPQTALFAELSDICRKEGAHFIVLTPGSLHWDRRETVAYHRLPDGSWRMTVSPWPDYVWRRATLRPARLADQLDRDESILRDHVINGALLRAESEKWQIYRELSEHADLRTFLPATVLVEQVEDVLRAARQWRDVYVKPARGTQGQQIVRLLTRGSSYDIRMNSSQGKSGKGVVRLTNEEAAHKFFTSRLRRREAYIVQETVALLKTAQGQPFDVRFLIQARPGASPVCTATVVKLGSPEAVTTNLHTGGQALLPSALESRLAVADRKRFLAGLKQGEKLAMTAFRHLSATRVGLTEMGMDVAIDVDGNAKLLEVNPCPGRRMLREINPGLRRLSLLRVVEYAVFCTGF